MEQPVTPQLGARLKDRREHLGWSLRDLEARCGVHNSLIYKIETGRVRDPSIQKLRRICDALELSTTQLLIDDDQLDPPTHRHLIDLLTPHLPAELAGQLESHFHDQHQLALDNAGGEEI